MESVITSRRTARLCVAALCSPLCLLGCAHEKSAAPRTADPRVAERLVVPEVKPPDVAVIAPLPSERDPLEAEREAMDAARQQRQLQRVSEMQESTGSAR